MTPEDFARAKHIGVSRRGPAHGPIDRALSELGLTRTISLVVASYLAAIGIASESDLVAAVPSTLVRRTAASRGLGVFPLPVDVKPTPVGQTWHPRFDADLLHRWLRTTIKAVCDDRSLILNDPPSLA